MIILFYFFKRVKESELKKRKIDKIELNNQNIFRKHPHPPFSVINKLRFHPSTVQLRTQFKRKY